MKKKLFKWLKVLVAIYLIIGIALYFLQEKLLFHPERLEQTYSFRNRDNSYDPNKMVDDKDGVTETFIELDKQTRFSIVQFRNMYKAPEHQNLTKGVVLYFHGNKQNITRYQPFAENFQKSEYEVWMCDYPGFGKSTGKLNEGILYEEAKQMYLLARQKFEDSNIVIYGKSLGSGIAAQLASTQKCRRLILETPYYSLTSIMKHFAPIYPVELTAKYKIPTHEYFKKIDEPITIFQGTNDWVVPYSNAIKLKMVMKPTDEFITIKDGTHNNLNDFPLYHQKLDSLLK